MACDHSDWYSGAARYLREAQLRLALVCDAVERSSPSSAGSTYRVHPRCVVDADDGVDRARARLSEGWSLAFALRGDGVPRGREQLSAEVLNKKGRSPERSGTEVRCQPELVAALLSDVSWTTSRVDLCHRERPDGAGIHVASSASRFPWRRAPGGGRGLCGDGERRRTALAAVTSKRVASCCAAPGSQFDAGVVRAFMAVRGHDELMLGIGRRAEPRAMLAGRRESVQLRRRAASQRLG